MDLVSSLRKGDNNNHKGGCLHAHDKSIFVRGDVIPVGLKSGPVVLVGETEPLWLAALGRTGRGSAGSRWAAPVILVALFLVETLGHFAVLVINHRLQPPFERVDLLPFSIQNFLILSFAPFQHLSLQFTLLSVKLDVVFAVSRGENFQQMLDLDIFQIFGGKILDHSSKFFQEHCFIFWKLNR